MSDVIQHKIINKIITTKHKTQQDWQAPHERVREKAVCTVSLPCSLLFTTRSAYRFCSYCIFICYIHLCYPCFAEPRRPEQRVFRISLGCYRIYKTGANILAHFLALTADGGKFTPADQHCKRGGRAATLSFLFLCHPYSLYATMPRHTQVEIKINKNKKGPETGLGKKKQFAIRANKK